MSKVLKKTPVTTPPRPSAATSDATKVRSGKVKVRTSPTESVADAKAPKPAKEKKPSKFISVDVFDGRRMKVMEYQDYTLTQQVKNKKTDEELAADWRTQFPQAVAFTPAHVGGARRDYNAGKHSKQFPKPTTPVPAYVITDGKRVPDTTGNKVASAA